MEEQMTVPYIVYEGTQARNERTAKRLIIALIIAVVMLFASNGLWLWAWMQYDYVDEGEEIALDINADDGGNANFIGRDLSGVLNNGENNNQSESENEETN